MFKYYGNSHLIQDCVKLANDLVRTNVEFREKICNAYFDMATCDGETIVDDMVSHLTIPDPYWRNSYAAEYLKIKNEPTPKKPNYPLSVKLYKSKNPFSKAYGYFTPSKPDHIYLNTRKLNRSRGSIVSSLIHEMIHYCDHKNQFESYGHGNNDPQGKENTAPYWIDNLAQSIIDNKLPDFNNNENSKIKYYVPWYYRLWNYLFGK